MGTQQVLVVVVVWVVIGLLTGLWMARRGHDWTWTLIAIALGPLFVLIAWERVERHPRVGPRCGLLVLARVVSYDATEPDSPQAVDAASTHLDTVARRVVGIPVNREVLAGPPGEALRRYAADHDLDVVVVGRRGRGLSERLLGQCVGGPPPALGGARARRRAQVRPADARAPGRDGPGSRDRANRTMTTRSGLTWHRGGQSLRPR